MIKKILITISTLTFIFSTTFALSAAGQKIIKNPANPESKNADVPSSLK